MDQLTPGCGRCRWVPLLSRGSRDRSRSSCRHQRQSAVVARRRRFRCRCKSSGLVFAGRLSADGCHLLSHSRIGLATAASRIGPSAGLGIHVPRVAKNLRKIPGGKLQISVPRKSQKLSSKVNRLNPGIRANDDFGQKLRKRQKCRARLVKTRIPRGAKNEQKVGGIHRVQVRSQYFQAIGKSNSEHSDK